MPTFRTIAHTNDVTLKVAFRGYFLYQLDFFGQQNLNFEFANYLPQRNLDDWFI